MLLLIHGDLLDADAVEFCSEFVSGVYQSAGMDRWLCGRASCLRSVESADDLRRMFQGNDSWVYGSDADELTPEPGDYLSYNNQEHSVLVVATSIDGRRLWRVGGNETGDRCVRFTRNDFFDEFGNINPKLYGFGSIQASFFD